MLGVQWLLILWLFLGDLNVEFGYPSAKLIEPDLYEFDFANNFGYGSFSAKTNWLAKADAYSNGYDLNYDRTLDYIMADKVCFEDHVIWTGKCSLFTVFIYVDFDPLHTFQRHKLPIQPAWMEIFQLQSDDTWYWGYLNREFDIPGVGKVSKNGYYNDVTDHWPVAATYLFEY